ncbi:hypothetical protein [Rhodoluna sp.]|jgi:hypothetical protein|uniref:hypothetical protein n=1 Tax=Rhodoluna sp. TaxID=1969481 RepID=UPI0025E6045B|nr:hypothetical protein [Rhodoluna sp.]
MQLVNFKDDRGSAVVEFIGFGLLLQILLLTGALQIAEVQKQQIAAEAIARHSLRSYVISGVSIESTAQQVARDFGIAQLPSVQLVCRPDCETPGALAQLRVVVGKAVAQSAMRVE